MKARVIVVLALAGVMLAPLANAQSIDEPRFVNRMLDDFMTPAMAPGGSGVFSFTVNNPDPLNLTSPMENVTIAISIYHYATLEESVPVSDMDKPPLMDGVGTATLVDCGDIQPGGKFPVELDIRTEKGTPHGSYFSQGTYFVRFVLEFTYQGHNYSMASRGHFTDPEWDMLKAGVGELNRTYLEELGYDGIIPDSAFSVRRSIPLWPFFTLVGLTALFGIMAISFHALDNPGRYPKLELKLLRLRGRLALWKMALQGKVRTGKK